MRAPISRHHNAGASTLEFALVASALIIACFGVIDVGILMWTQEAIESAAVLTARCTALGSSLCSDPRQFAVNTVTSQTFAGVISTDDVWVQSKAACSSTQGTVSSGNYTVVRITASFWATGLLPAPLNSKTLTAAACFPSGT